MHTALHQETNYMWTNMSDSARTNDIAKSDG